ncbi:hypothetical protein [Vibrio mexicanus]|uniref:hypothetical protein n=1 Tax=Vibrio mexicanus TaxID=1004326 RepID=UPI000AFAAA49|nr:hypothetical protein [Vibrio mexicanus]
MKGLTGFMFGRMPFQKAAVSSVIVSAVMSTSVLANQEVAPVRTSMDTISEERSIPCSVELRGLASKTLKQNPHRMLAYGESDSDNQMFNALAVAEYRDRGSHVTFHGVVNSQGRCDTSVTESFILQTSCSDARHEAFSKWDFQGKLNQNTMVLSSKRVNGKQAFLTDQFGLLCLVTTRQVVSS